MVIRYYRKIFRLVVLSVLALAADCPIAVAEEMPLFYARTNIVILPQRIQVTPQQSLPWLPKQEENAQQNITQPSQGLSFDAELRDARTVHTAGWVNLSELGESQALMLMFPSPVIAAIRPVRDYSLYDVLTVSQEGQIQQILPNLVLAELQQPYQTPSEVKAIIYLRGGTCDRRGIAPGDRILHKMFRPPAAVRQIIQ